ncbi:MAG TPA: GGDEF domain-containing protein, partial [Patescibacteria group bacterium]|nr:GGDEF domain-containing protein [Patescibacteria group bacterium]
YIRLNKRTAQIHGEEKENLIGKNIYDLYPREQAHRYFQEDRQVIETGVSMLNIEEPQETPEGVIWHNVTKVPLKDDNGSIIGVVGIAMDITERKRAEEEIKTLVQQLETAKKNAEETAMTDSLTNLANRRYFDETLKLEFHRLQRSQEPLSLIMIDIDYFKKFNDRYGHIAGDNCLKEVALTIKGELKRSSDVAARYGGEEFVVILPNSSSQGAVGLAENIRKALEKRSIPHLDSLFSKHVTISLGVATITPSDLNTAELVLRMADAALYRAKETGRNRVAVATEEGHS